MWRNCHEKKEISIHVPLRGGRLHNDFVDVWDDQFQSTSPYAGDDQRPMRQQQHQILFQSTSPYAGDDKAMTCKNCIHYISIHVPLRGGRHLADSSSKLSPSFQSTSPYAGDDSVIQKRFSNESVFQSTSPYAGDDTHWR